MAGIAQISKNLNLIFKHESALAKQFISEHKFLEKFERALTPIRTTFLEGIETVGISLGCGKDLGKSFINFAQKDAEFLKSKFLGKSLPEKLKNFSKRFFEKRKQTGARRVAPIDELEAWDVWAPQQYAKIKECKTDIKIIAENTKMPVHKIKRIKEHIFYDNTHILDRGIGKFSPDPEIASAWDRLASGDFIETDIKLLEHEYFESKFEKIFKTNYRDAHKAAEKTGRKWYSFE